MVVGVLRLEMFLPTAQNLKERRGMVRRILGRCRQRFPVSCAEIGSYDLWQRAELGFSAVGHHRDELERMFEKVEEHIESLGLGSITESDRDYLQYS
ncbi:MAG: DUF503 domain-containing protein [Desulfuromonas sp.]|nr:MAG: DUF503 domain-containing protein [Desulfuromonas sp.]